MDVIFLPLGLSGRRSIVVTHVRLSVPPSVCPSVRTSPEACPHNNSKGISYKFTKLAHKMYHSKLKIPIVFERSRSKVKVTKGQKVKHFDRPYLENYWADSLQTKTIGFLSTSRTKMLLILFFVRCTIFEIFAILCFFGLSHFRTGCWGQFLKVKVKGQGHQRSKGQKL